MSNLSIKPDRDYLPKIIDKIESGEFSIPLFQREYKWDQKQRIDLIDSIIKGYPIGSLIVWQPSEDKFSTLSKVGGVQLGNKVADSNIFYVLDGRQRLTSVIALLHSDGNLNNTISVDLKSFEVIPTPSKYVYHVISVNDVFDPYKVVDFIDTLRKNKLEEEEVKLLTRNVKKLNSIFLSYEIGYTLVKGGGIEDATEIFSRLNSRGIDINTVDMMQALTYPSDSNFLFRDAIKNLREELADQSFCNLPDDTILKALAINDGKSFVDFKPEILYKGRSSGLREVWLRTVKSIKASADFLVSQCYIRDFKWMPYNIQFLLLNTFFAKVNAPDESKLTDLRKWFFRTTFSREYNNASMGVIKNAVTYMDAFINGKASVLELEFNSSDKHNTLPANPQSKSVDASILKMALCYSLETAGHTIQQPVYWRVVVPLENRDQAANWFLCDSYEAVANLMKVFKGEREWSESMTTYGLTREIVNAYLAGNYTVFNELRREHLLQMINDFKQKMCSASR